MQYSMFRNLDYLKNGSEIQRKSFQLLKDHAIFERLIEYNPILIGTIPIDLATQQSDLDIACEVYDLLEFRRRCENSFGNFKEYAFKIKTVHKKEVGIATFKIAEIWVEVYAEGIAVIEQYGYKHMMKEFQILTHFGNEFKNEILRLKLSGFKTESAFAKLLRLDGDSYESLLTYNIDIDGDKNSRN